MPKERIVTLRLAGLAVRGLKTLYLPGGTQKSSGRKTRKSLSRHTKKVRNHLSRPTIFWTVRTYLELSGHILNCPDTSWTVRTNFGLSGHILSCLDKFWTVRTHFGLSGHNLSCPDTSWTVRTYFDCLDIFWTVPTNFPDWTMTQNLPDGPKSSGWQCHPATGIFRPLLSWLVSSESESVL